MSIVAAAAFAGAFAAALILPGPNVAYCIAQSLHHGFRKALPIAVGFCIATAIHALVVFSSIALVSSQLPGLLTVLKWVGVSYLIWLSYKAFNNAKTLKSAQAESVSTWQLISGAMIVSLTNPKGIAASIILYPAFISDKGSYLVQATVLSVIAVCISLAVYTSYIALASRLRTTLEKKNMLHIWVGTLYALSALGVLLVNTGS